MSLYKRSETNIQNFIEETYREDEFPKERMKLGIADMLTGPTSAYNAEELANRLLSFNDPKEVAITLIEIGMRYLKDSK